MADRITPTQAGVEKPMREEPEAKVASAVQDDPESIRSRGTAAEQQRDEYLALLQRTRADFENYQKRVQRDQAEERRYAHAAFARDLLPVVDNLQRALDAARQEIEMSPLSKGVALVQSQLLDIFSRYGITPIDALGQLFDPHRHESVQQQFRPDLAPGTVVAVPEPGYSLHERILRPSKVVVAAPSNSEKGE
jgi:molecular chaperone GrpE